MADKLKVEIQEHNVDVPADLKNDLTKFMNEIQSKAKEAKQQKTLAEAQKILDGAQISVDYKDLALQIDGVILKFDTRLDLDTKISEIENDLNREKGINAELASLELDLRRDQQKVVDENKVTVKNLSNKVNETANEKLIAMLQKVVDDQKDLKTKFEEFTAKNSPEGSSEDVAKMFELTNKLQGALVSKDALLTSTLTAASVSALEEQNKYLRGIVEGYEKEGAKFDIKKFKEKNQKHISKDLQQLAKQFNIDLGGNTVSDKKDTTPTEKTYEQMSDLEKQTKLKNIMNELSNSLKMTQNAQGQCQINMTGAQYDQIMSVYQMGGANAGYHASGIEPKVAPGLGKVTKFNNKAERLRARGKLDKAVKFKKRAFEEAQDVAKSTKKLAAYSMATAEENNKTEHFAELTNQVEGYASENGYNGMTIDVVPYAPLFPNICEQIGRQQIRGVGYIDTASHGKVMINCPERLVSGARSYMMQGFQNSEPSLYADCQKNGGGLLGKDNILSNLFEKTNMSKEQAQKNSTLVFAGVGIFAGLGLLRWIRTGKFAKDETKPDKWYDRVGKLILGGIGLNMVSQGLNGRGILDNAKLALSGKMKLSDLWTKHGPEGQYYAPLDCAKNCLRFIPGTMLAQCCDKQNNGDAKIDFVKLEALLTTLIASEKDPAKKKALEDNLAYIKLMQKDPKGQEYLNLSLANLGLNYDKLSKTNESIDTTAEAARQRQLEVVKYMTDNKLQFADGITWLDTDISDFVYQNKGSLDDLKKKGKFVDAGISNPMYPDGDISKKVGPDGKIVDRDPKEYLDAVLLDIDLPLAKQLQNAKLKLAKDSIDIEFEKDAKTGVLMLKSVQMVTPIMYDKGGWYIGGSSSGRGVDRFPTRFENVEQALWVAHNTNRLIHEYSGKYKSVNEPFSASGENRDLMVGGSNTLLQRFLDTQALASGTANKLGGAEFARNIQGYALYLNGICNTNGESIWNEAGKVGYDFRASYFENRLKGSTPLPKLKKEDEFNPNKKTTTPENKDLPPVVAPDKIDINNPKEVLNEKSPEFTAEDIALGDKRYEQYNHKDGGDKLGKNPLERNKTFFHLWAKSFNDNTPYFTVDAYGMLGAGKGKKYGIIYERLVGNVAPRRIKVTTGWYGHNKQVNEKPE